MAGPDLRQAGALVDLDAPAPDTPPLTAPLDGQPAPDVDDLGQRLVALFRLLDRTGAQLSARRQDGLERAAFSVLHHLVHGGPLRARELADAVLADPSTVSRHVAHLVSLGLVERRADPLDGRATVLAATGQGVDKAAELRARRNATVAAVVADWSGADRDAFAGLLDRFTTDLERRRPALLADCAPTSAPDDDSDDDEGPR